MHQRATRYHACDCSLLSPHACWCAVAWRCCVCAACLLHRAWSSGNISVGLLPTPNFQPPNPPPFSHRCIPFLLPQARASINDLVQLRASATFTAPLVRLAALFRRHVRQCPHCALDATAFCGAGERCGRLVAARITAKAQRQQQVGDMGPERLQEEVTPEPEPMPLVSPILASMGLAKASEGAGYLSWDAYEVCASCRHVCHRVCVVRHVCLRCSLTSRSVWSSLMLNM